MSPLIVVKLATGGTHQQGAQMNEWHLPSLDPFWLWLVAVVLGFSGFLAVAEAVGILPRSVSRWLNKNRLSQTIETLRTLGLDVDAVRRRNIASIIPEQVDETTLAKRVKARLKPAIIKRRVMIGSVNSVPSKSFVNLMGACSDHRVATILARDLLAYWRTLLADETVALADDFDFVVTPKSGCLLLGYEFARAVGKPFVGYNSEPKFQVKGAPDFRAHFDASEIPPENSRALIVDDSTTGGGKATAIIQSLRKFDYQVSDFLVIFEPELKNSTGENSASKLRPLGVRLHSIVKT